MKGGLPLGVGLLLVAVGCGGGGGGEGAATAVAPSYERSLPNGHPLAVASADADVRSREDELTRLTNDYLVSRGQNALIVDSELQKVSRAHSQHMIVHGFFDHLNPEGQWPWDRAEAVGIVFTGYGENLAAGQDSAFQAFQDFLASPDHKRVIEDPDWTHLGCGYAQSPGGLVRYWTQNFKSDLQNR